MAVVRATTLASCQGRAPRQRGESTHEGQEKEANGLPIAQCQIKRLAEQCNELTA